MICGMYERKDQAFVRATTFVNNKLVANLDLSAAQNSGDVLPGLSFFNDGVNGRRLRFEHFVVASNATLQLNTQAATLTATPRQ